MDSSQGRPINLNYQRIICKV